MSSRNNRAVENKGQLVAINSKPISNFSWEQWKKENEKRKEIAEKFREFTIGQRLKLVNPFSQEIPIDTTRTSAVAHHCILLDSFISKQYETSQDGLSVEEWNEQMCTISVHYKIQKVANGRIETKEQSFITTVYNSDLKA
jgi:hypothetical protein